MLRWVVAFALLSSAAAAGAQPAERPRIGLALGGGSAHGIAHVGVLRWLEEHHVPIDGIAGSSMGGLIGGAYAAGMSPGEIETLLAGIDWDAMFGASEFRFDHVRRKRDLREYSSRLEFGFTHGVAAAPALNSGQQVGLLLSRIAAAYYGVNNFDELPTPFRCVAVDLRTARQVVMRDGSLARAMRATMSVPLTFPPVIAGDQVLVDGGTLNQIPTDVARGMGATTVIAVNVGDLGSKRGLNYSLLGLVAETLDAMIRANAAVNLAAADVRITVPLDSFGYTAFDRAHDLIRAGYDAAEAARDQLLPLAVDDTSWDAWREKRRSAIRTMPSSAAFIRIDGAGPSDTQRMLRRLSMHRDAAVDVGAIEQSVTELGGLDRFETITWTLAADAGRNGLVFTAIPKINGPPFLLLGATLENTTSNEFRFGVGARYLAFDVLGSGTELRADLTLGSEPGIGVRWYRPISSSPFFVEPIAGITTSRISIIDDGQITAEYGRRQALAGFDLGVNPGRLSELRIGARFGRTDANVRLGKPELPEIKGPESSLEARWTYDDQDDAQLPSRGTYLGSIVTHALRAAQPVGTTSDRDTTGVTKVEASWMWARRLSRDGGRRFFAMGGAGSALGGRPLEIDQFALGGLMHLTAFGLGEVRGDHYINGGAGYLHRLLHLPDFLGRSVFVGGWLETGSAFDHASDAEIAVHASAGVIADSLLGPIFAGASVGASGNSRWFIGMGRIFR